MPYNTLKRHNTARIHLHQKIDFSDLAKKTGRFKKFPRPQSDMERNYFTALELSGVTQYQHNIFKQNRPFQMEFWGGNRKRQAFIFNCAPCKRVEILDLNKGTEQA